MRILLVDDSSVMRKIVLRALRQAGFSGHDFDEADNGRDALAKIESARPDVVLSDWNMPEMTGMELLLELKQKGIETRFAFITSEATQPMRLAAIRAGARAFVTKPFTPDTIRTALSGLLE